jgi:hypothetical protein
VVVRASRPCTSPNPRRTHRSFRRSRRHKLTPSPQGGGHTLAHRGNGCCSLAGLSTCAHQRRFRELVPGSDARRRQASRLPEMYPRCTRVLHGQATRNANLQAFSRSPLTDSNRRPPPYHRTTRREWRARAGSRGHENPGSRRNRPKRSSRAWTRVSGRTFPQCSLGSDDAPTRSDERMLAPRSLSTPTLLRVSGSLRLDRSDCCVAG